MSFRGFLAFATLLVCATTLSAQGNRAPAAGANAASVQATAPEGVAPSADYKIGADDVLSIVFWREKDLSGDVTVRPDGKITLPLLNELDAAGLTPEQLREKVRASAGKFVQDPEVTVLVKTMNSRRVFITGQVGKPGAYPLMGATTVLQLIAMAGGVSEYADAENISVMRTENGKATALRFNYKDVSKRKKLEQNVELKPGDTVIVP